jgi:hypothetical protein
MAGEMAPGRLVISLVLLIGPMAVFAEPELSTRGNCSGIATNGARVNTRCNFIVRDRKSAQRGQIVIQQAWLAPSLAFMSPQYDGSLDEQAVLTTIVRNLTADDLILTAARLEIVGKTTLALKGNILAEGVLHAAIGDTRPIKVEAGQSAKIILGDTIILPDIISGIERDNNMDTAMLVYGISPPRINGRQYVDRMSQLMSRLYGKSTIIRVTYFTNDYRPVARLDLPIDKGADLFYNGETFDVKTQRHAFRPLLAYDAFLGGYLKQKELWVRGFKIREPPARCIDAIPDSTVPGGMRYRDDDCTDDVNRHLNVVPAPDNSTQ